MLWIGNEDARVMSENQSANSATPTSAPSKFPWPPILYGLAIVVGFVLSTYYPLPWISGSAADFAFMAGLMLVAGAIFVDVRTFLELRKHQTTILPTRAASRLVTSGPFSLSRNPIYLSNTVLTFGLALAFGNLWLIICGLVAALATNELAIKREERHLALKFGSRWRDYAKRVRRWI
jgi:protein-S-isoprenylcysteine O-methyltransferase Ste14